MKFLIFLLFPSLHLFGQTAFCGKVISIKNKEIIPFATIGLMKENIGTNANEGGIFSLISKNNKTDDTLIISCVGYLTKLLPVERNKIGNLVIELTDLEKILDEVIVKSSNTRKSITINEFSKCPNHFITTSGYQRQIAQYFRTAENNSLLTNIKICRRSIGILDPDKTIFRIRIYDIDTVKRSPSKDLCDQIIEIKTRSKFINLNLDQYKILIPSKEFFVAIEWLKIPYNANKGTTKVNGNDVEHITYSPSIGWTENKNAEMTAWMLDYNNIWRPMFKMNNMTSLSISATVKY